MKTIPLGNSPLKSSVIGLGCNRLLDVGDAEALATVDEALARGINHFDGADMYGAGRGEEFLGKALKDRGDGIIVASKFGMVPKPEGGFRFIGTPEYVRQACDESLARMGLDCIDLYYQHRVDPEVPIEETIGAMAELIENGKVRALAVCNATADEIRRANATHPLACVQMEYSLFTREPEAEILPVCQELGITFVAYGPLSFALLAGALSGLEDIPEDDGYRRNMPRFQDDNIGHNLELAEVLREIAEELAATPGQVALAWPLAGPYDVIPIPGSRRTDHLIENAGAADISLTEAQMEKIDAAFQTGVAKGSSRSWPRAGNS